MICDVTIRGKLSGLIFSLLFTLLTSINYYIRTTKFGVYFYLPGTKSRVLYKTLLSHLVPIEQGTRQGSLLSPLFYSVFINDLIVLLCESEAGLKIGEVYLTAPIQADDLLLNFLTKSELQRLIHI